MAKTPLEPRKAVEFLKRSELINMDMPLSRLTDAISGIDEVAGYVIAWDKYVLVVGAQIEQELEQIPGR